VSADITDNCASLWDEAAADVPDVPVKPSARCLLVQSAETAARSPWDEAAAVVPDFPFKPLARWLLAPPAETAAGSLWDETAAVVSDFPVKEVLPTYREKCDWSRLYRTFWNRFSSSRFPTNSKI
jgi:hypothetical protein